MVLVALLFTALTLPALAGVTKSKQVTLFGKAMCAKCVLHQGEKCQTVLQIHVGKKTRTYYLAPNKVSRDFHTNVCQEARKVMATGRVTNEHGKLILVASKIKLIQ